MGAPLTSFHFFDVLAQAGPHPDPHGVIEAVTSFSLFAFVLHDPARHPETDRLLHDSFRRLDRDTGDALLFFSFLDPPEGWVDTAVRQRRYLTGYDAPARDPEREARVLQALTLRFDLDPSDLPCLLLTDDLRGRDFVRVDTSPAVLSEQLQRLGELAATTPERWTDEAVLDTLSHRDEARFGRLDTSIAGALSRSLAFLPDRTSTWVDPRMRHSQAATVRAALAALQPGRSGPGLPGGELPGAGSAPRLLSDLYLAAAVGPEVEGRGLFDRDGLNAPEAKRSRKKSLILDPVAEMLDLLDPIGRPDPIDLTAPLGHDDPSMEADSQRALATVRAIEPLVCGLAGADLSACGILLGKVLEREVGLSVVHWVRGEEGVRLPTYYTRYDRGATVRIPTGPHRYADFNLPKSARKGDAWRAPTLGDALYGCKAYVADRGRRQDVEGPPMFDAVEWQRFTHHWATLLHKRNESAHPGAMSVGEYARMREAFSTIVATGTLGKLGQIKRSLRSDAPRGQM